MLDVEGFILVGGASSRMGVNKANLLLNGKTTVSLISEALRPVTSRVSVVGTSVEATGTGLPGVSDLHESWGPLGGIQAALHACKTELCVVIACDLPFVTGELFAYLLQIECGANTTPAAVVPLQSDGRPQPLCAVYRKKACLAAAEKSIALGEHSPRAMLDRIETRYVNFNDFRDLSGSEHFFLNLNHPQDYEQAKEIALQRRPAG